MIFRIDYKLFYLIFDNLMISFLIVECGKTSTVVRSNALVINSTTEYLPCSNEKPCYCYGRLCLIGGNCSSGFIYLDGRPISGIHLKHCDKARICKEMGFQNFNQNNFPKKLVI